MPSYPAPDWWEQPWEGGEGAARTCESRPPGVLNPALLGFSTHGPEVGPFSLPSASASSKGSWNRWTRLDNPK